MSKNPENAAENEDERAEGSEETALSDPVFDPDLPEEVIEKLAASPKKLLAPDKPPKRTEPSTPGQRAFTLVFFLFATVVVTALVWFLAAVLLPLIAGLFAIIALVTILYAFGSGGCLAGFVTLFAVAALTGFGQWLGPDGAPIAIAVLVGLFGLLVSFAAASDGNEHTQLAAKYHGHYVRPEDLDKDSQRLLLRVQRARTYIAESSGELGDSFDSVQPDLILRDQEWQLARILREQTRLEKDLDKRAKKAMSQTVLDSMKPQFDAVHATRSAVQRRVRTIEEYRDKVSRAIRAQREWAQVEANVARHAEYGDLVAQASSGLGDESHLSASVDLAAIKQVRDASVREALDAGQWLSEASSLT